MNCESCALIAIAIFVALTLVVFCVLFIKFWKRGNKQ